MAPNGPGTSPYWFGASNNTMTWWNKSNGVYFVSDVIRAIDDADLFARRIRQSLALAQVRMRPFRPKADAGPNPPVVLRMERRARTREGVRAVIRQRRRLARFV